MEVLKEVLFEMLILEGDESLSHKMREIEGNSAVGCEFFAEFYILFIEAVNLVGNVVEGRLILLFVIFDILIVLAHQLLSDSV
jgi:hypothetical protein